jgi:chemotaxis protein methyltransferase CheR
MHELEVDGFRGYREHLEAHDEEWSVLDRLCRITISRFWRDRAVFEALLEDVVPTLAASVLDRGDETIRCWSCGCASGEEPYSIRIGWHMTRARQLPDVSLDIVATDSDPHMLQRAQRAVYPWDSIRDLPSSWQERAFDPGGDNVELRAEHSGPITWLCQDVRSETPKGPFDLVLCRNLVFTYYDESLQLEITRRLADSVRAGGALVVGSHETLPPGQTDFEPWPPHGGIHRRRP